MDRWYSRAGGWTDGTTKFHEMCREAVRGAQENPSLLEIGAGPPNPSSDFFAALGTLTGVDVDPIVRSNPALVNAVVVEAEELPFEDCSFDACFSSWLLEHVEDPSVHLKEVARVLKPGGRYVARTPNRYHYVSIAAAMSPHWFHRLVANRLRALPEETHEPWPTYYRLNTRRAITRSAADSGLRVSSIVLIESEPSYGFAARPLFLLLMAYERLVNSTPLLEGLRHTVNVVFDKPGPSGEKEVGLD